MWALGTAAELPPFPRSHPPPQPHLPVLAVHTQNHTTKITSIGIAPEGPRQTRRVKKPGGNKCVWIQRRVGLGGTKLAGGRQGSWLGGAGCCARGSRPGRRPRPPRPQPAPHRGRRRRAGLRPRPPDPAAAALASELGRSTELRHSGRLRSALGSGFPSPVELQAQQPLPPGAPELESCDRRSKGRSWRRKPPLRLHALQPSRAGLVTVALSDSAPRWRLPKLPQFIPAEMMNCGALAGGLFPQGNPKEAPRSAPSPSHQNSQDLVRQLVWEWRIGTCGG